MVCSMHRGAQYIGAYNIITPVNVSHLHAGIAQQREGYVSS